MTGPAHGPPSLTLIAGANGAGKSTFVRAMNLDSIDPDRIAAAYGEGFTPAANLRASREALRRIDEALAARHDLTVETTLASRQPLRLLQAARDAGYTTRLAFVTPGLEDTRLRIDNRVLEGGHNIPDDVLRRRTPRILANLPQVLVLADLSALYLSSRTAQNFRLVGAAHAGELLLTPEVPGDLASALRSLPAGWTALPTQAVPPDHPVWTEFRSLVTRQFPEDR